jgi:hypothetical protein
MIFAVLIHDDHAPEHRGDRMACTPIMRKYRHKAVAREWFGNGAPTPVSGRLEFVQDEGDMSHSLVDLDGLGGQVNIATKFKKLLLSFSLRTLPRIVIYTVLRCQTEGWNGDWLNVLEYLFKYLRLF